MYAITLPKGVTVTKLGYLSGNYTPATGTITHQWLVLLDNAYNYLAATADKTTTDIGSKTAYDYAIANTQGNTGASSFTTTYEGVYYIGVMVAGTSTMPTLMGFATVASTNMGSSFGVPLAGTNATDVSLTTPPTTTQTYHAPTTVNGVAYVWAS